MLNIHLAKCRDYVSRLWAHRRRTYLLLAVPNIVLILLNLLFLLQPQLIERLMGVEVGIPVIPSFPPKPSPAIPASLVTGRLAAGTSLDILLREKGFSPAQVHELFTAARPAYDLSKIKAGHEYVMEFAQPGGSLDRFRYEIDEERVLTLKKSAGKWQPEIKSQPLERRVEAVTGTISDSLIGAIQDAGEKDMLALEMANIFQWDVDFNTDLRKGDSFRVVVEKQFIQGRFIKYGPVFAAELSNQGKVYKGFRYQPPGGRLEYFSADGRPMRRELLKSPLPFMAPISSRFSNRRFHPILKRYTTHFGVDFSCPTGTPVLAIADGKVAKQGVDPGGGGNMIRLEHKQGMSSMYLHLSRYAEGLAAGSSVRQGEVIGYSGESGLATGPHLDFRLLKGNRYLNPVKVNGAPVAPLTAALLPAFFKIRDDWMQRLKSVPLPVSAKDIARK
jgi:murein DD-endopeptidase MepM/ murein hydrolase activator NlpD